MRIVLIGASSLAVATARALLDRGDEVVIIDNDEERIAELSDELDCGFVHGDGSRPSVLEEVSPENTDYLLCLSGSDQSNIIAAMVGRELKFPQVMAKIDSPEFEPICHGLGLSNTIVPDREVGNSLADLIEGHKDPGLRARCRGDVRFFSFVAGERDAGRAGELGLPGDSRVVSIARGDDAQIATDDSRIEADDVVLVLTRRKHVDQLRERFNAGDGEQNNASLLDR